MNDLLDQLIGHVRSAWRFRWVGFLAAVVVAIVGWIFVFSIPDRYSATASVFVDTRTALKPVLEGLVVENDVMSQLGYVRQSILSGPKLEKLALDAGLLTGSEDTRSKAGVLGALAGGVTVHAEQASADAYQASGTIYSITYENNDPDLTVKVTNTVLDTFIRETLGGKQENVEAAQKFLADQIAVNEDRLKDIENRIAEFKKKNIGLMPTDRGDYFSELQAAIDAGKKAQNDLDVAMVRRSELARQLRGESVISATSVPTAQGSGGADTASRIRDAQARLDELLLRFTDKHPDVVEARDALNELQARRTAELESLRRGEVGAVAASGLSGNPIYQSIQLEINRADVDIASLRGQVTQHNAKAAELRKLLETAPTVAAEYAQLNRDYDIIKSQHSALLENYEKARLGEQADNAGGVRFQLVQPPVAELSAASMHRHLLFAGVLVIGMLVGAGLAYLIGLLRPVVISVHDLVSLTDLPVLGVVSPAFPQQLHRQARNSVLRFGLAACLLVAGLAVVLMLNSNGLRLGAGVSGAG